MKTAVIGYGYWGKNITRVISQSVEFELVCICDSGDIARSNAKKLYPYANICCNIDEVHDDVEVVAICTPTSSHYAIGKHFLTKNSNILITKPFTESLAQTEELCDLAKSKDLCAFADYTFVFNPAVRKLKEMLPRIGKPYFIISQRLNLGLYQPDVNVAYDLLPHDISIISFLFDSIFIETNGFSIKAAKMPQEDMAHVYFKTDVGVEGSITVSWLSPYKIRQFIIVGEDGMLSYDDAAVAEKVKFFDKGLSINSLLDSTSHAAYTQRISYRSGDLYSPAIPNSEALALELDEFYKAIIDRKTRAYYNDLNLRIMSSLEMAIKATHKG